MFSILNQCWTQWRSEVLKKAGQQKGYMNATGGGPPSSIQFSHLDDQLLALLGPDANGLSNVKEGGLAYGQSPAIPPHATLKRRRSRHPTNLLPSINQAEYSQEKEMNELKMQHHWVEQSLIMKRQRMELKKQKFIINEKQASQCHNSLKKIDDSLKKIHTL